MPGPIFVRSIAAMAIAILLMGAQRACAAADPGRVCAASKQKAAFKLAGSLGKCIEKSVKNDVPVDNECILKASTKFTDSFAKAEGKGGCATNADASSIQNMVNGCVAQIVQALPSSQPVYTCAPSGGSGCGGTCPPGQSCSGHGSGGADCYCDF
jgi:hypothetical protein